MVQFAEFDLSNYKHKSRQQQQGINYELSDFVTLEEQQRNNEQEELEVDEEDEDDEEEIDTILIPMSTCIVMVMLTKI